MKKGGRETTKVKSRNALPVARHRGPTADLKKQLDQRTRELKEAQKHLAEALDSEPRRKGMVVHIPITVDRPERHGQLGSAKLLLVVESR